MTCQSQEPSVVQWTSNIISSIELKMAIPERDRIVDVDCICSCSASHYKKFYSQSWATGIQRPQNWHSLGPLKFQQNWKTSTKQSLLIHSSPELASWIVRSHHIF